MGKSLISLIALMAWVAITLPFFIADTPAGIQRQHEIHLQNTQIYWSLCGLISISALGFAFVRGVWRGIGWLSVTAGIIACISYAVTPDALEPANARFILLVLSPLVAPGFYGVVYHTLEISSPPWFRRIWLLSLLCSALYATTHATEYGAMVIMYAVSLVAFCFLVPLILRRWAEKHPDAGPLGLLCTVFVIGNTPYTTISTLNIITSPKLDHAAGSLSMLLSVIFLTTLLLHFIFSEADRIDRFLHQQYQIKDASFFFDMTGVVVHKNNRAQTLFIQLNSLSDLIAACASEHRSEAADCFNRVTTTKSQHEILEVSLERARGGMTYAEIELTVQSKDFVHVRIQDITNRKMVALSLLENAAVESSGVIAAAIAHDFNNALCAISGHLSLLALQTPESSSHSAIVDMLNNVEDATRVSHRMMRMAHPHQEQPELLDLPKVLADLLPIVEQRYPDVVFDLVLSDDTIQVLVPRSTLDISILAFVRTCINAGATRLHITLKRNLNSGRSSIVFIDNGPSYNVTDAQHLDSPHYSTSNRKYPPDFFIAVRAIRTYDLHTSLSNQKNSEGFKLEIQLPIHNQAPIDFNTSVTNVNHSILIVDDDPDILESTATYLRWRGYTIRTAQSTRDARVLCQTRLPDLLLTDIRLPEEKGTVLAQEIAQEHPSIAIVLMSGDFTPDVNALPTRWQRVQKPFSPEELVTAIRMAMLTKHQGGQS